MPPVAFKNVDHVLMRCAFALCSLSLSLSLCLPPSPSLPLSCLPFYFPSASVADRQLAPTCGCGAQDEATVVHHGHVFLLDRARSRVTVPPQAIIMASSPPPSTRPFRPPFATTTFVHLRP
uniref:Putative secreted protein n=1 Tax=Anopheles darlingi TaxID=43151 RepID=A0A2M4D9T4_ANODA